MLNSNLSTRAAWALLLAVHFACGLHTAWSKCVTHDEIWHLPVGLLHWRTGRFDQDILNPPMTRLWAAIPAVLAGIEVEPGVDATDIAQKFVAGHDDYQRWYFWGRTFNLVCSVLTGWIVACWADRWFGATASILATAFYSTCPNILAHCSLVTPDAGLMLGFVAVLWRFLSWREAPSVRGAAILGLVLGLTQATKFTAVVLYPLLGAMWLLAPASSINRLSGRRAVGHVAIVLLTSLLAWNAAFLFRGTGRPLASYAAESQTLRSVQSLAGPFAQWPLPLPADYMAGLDRQKGVMEQVHPVFLDGAWSTQPFPDYFLRTLQYKLPHLLQGAVVLGGLVWMLRRGDSLRFRRLAVLIVPTAVLLGIASFSSLQLGVRYVLPILPLLMLCAAALGPSLDSLRPGARWITVGLIVLAAGGSLRHHPHHLAYFNEAAGGPIGGREHLLDSNLDWGQDLHLVREFMMQQQLDEIGLVYYGTLPAERVGIRFHISRSRAPEPGWHAVSVNYVMGRPHLLREPGGRSRPADIMEFAYFHALTPVARLGYSIDVYHVPESASSRR